MGDFIPGFGRTLRPPIQIGLKSEDERLSGLCFLVVYNLLLSAGVNSNLALQNLDLMHCKWFYLITHVGSGFTTSLQCCRIWFCWWIMYFTKVKALLPSPLLFGRNILRGLSVVNSSSYNSLCLSSKAANLKESWNI